MPLPFFTHLTDAELFPLINIVLPAWVLLAVGPKWRLTQAAVNVSALLMCLLYVLLTYTMLMQPGAAAISFSDMNSWKGVAKLLSTESAVLPAWIHYVAFDLWAGRWIAMDSVNRRFPRLLLAPVLFLTMLLGPAGLLLYMLVRGNWRIKTKAKAE